MSETLIAGLKIPQHLKTQLLTLLTPVPSDVIPYFTTEIQNYRDEISSREDCHEVCDKDLLDQLCDTSLHLLQRLPNLPEAKQKLILAAIRNFILDEEGDADFQHPYGFDGDAIIFNEILELVELEEEQIPL